MLVPVKREVANDKLTSRLNDLEATRNDALGRFVAGEVTLDSYIKGLSLKIKSIELCLGKTDAWYYTDGEELYIQHTGSKTTYKPIFDKGRWVMDIKDVKEVTLYTKPECFIDRIDGVSNFSKMSNCINYLNDISAPPLKCNKCGGYFQLTPGECRFYRVNKKRPPNTCQDCRDKNS